MKIKQEALMAFGTRILIIILILLGALIIAKSIKYLMLKKKKFIKVDTTQYRFLTHFISGLIYFWGIILAVYSIPSMRGFALSIFAGSGVIAVIIGFASQQAFANIVSGIFIALFKPFRIGDRIRLIGKDFYGVVEDISLRHTVIKTFELRRIVIPNSLISVEILENDNIIDTKILKFWEIGISYDSDVKKAIQIIQEEVEKHPDFLISEKKEAVEKIDENVTVRVIGYGDFSVNLRAYVWAKDSPTAFQMSCDLNESIKERFDNEGIEIPFPYRTIVFKDKE